MLIDNEKFIALLVENSGLEKDKVESYLEELVSEIKKASSEGDGFEIEGFGVFSKLGANILFIPSEELETEINYKYVGMEPISLSEGGSEEVDSEDSDESENPIEGILDTEASSEESDEEYDDPFAELMGELDEDQVEDSDENTSDAEAKEEEEVKDSLEELLDEDATLETEDEEIEMPGPDKWGIDAHKEDDQENAFSGLIGSSDSSSSKQEEEDIFTSSDELEDEEGDTEEIEKDKVVESSDEDRNDFDDPFLGLDEEDQDEEKDFVPVVTNVSSDIREKEQEAIEEEAKEPEKKESKPKKPAPPKKKSAPVYLYMVLVLVILGGTGYILALLGVVNVKGITPEEKPLEPITITIPLPQPDNSVPQQVDGANNTPEQTNNLGDGSNTTQEATNQPKEPATEQKEEVRNDMAPIVADEKAPDASSIITPVTVQGEAATYGLNGTATEDGNNGYTIVLYTLSRKSGADAQFEKLSKEGYRVIIKEIPSQRYGALYRVSIGQFESLVKAAIAAEKVDASILGNYIISKI